MFCLLAWEKNRQWARVATACGRPASGDDARARTTRGKEVLLSSSPLLLLFLFFFLLFPQSTADGQNRPPTIDFFLNRSPMAEIDRRQLILAVPPGSGPSTYR
ncbi:hypothetical protein BHM03_00046481 [Ensete ventricosum]|nr:hypothetical protein BHM03_00046481 [Ensete ventricosum]